MELVTKVKPNINSVEVHPQLSNNRHPLYDALVGAGSVSPNLLTKSGFTLNHVKGLTPQVIN
jgi:hypothetical protein